MSGVSKPFVAVREKFGSDCSKKGEGELSHGITKVVVDGVPVRSSRGAKKQVPNPVRKAGSPSPYLQKRESKVDAVSEVITAPPLGSSQSTVIQDVRRYCSCLAPPFAIVPPMRFSMVEDNLYRGGYPTLRNFPCLQTLGLRCILSLTPEKPTYDLEQFAEADNIALHHVPVERYKGEVVLSPSDISSVLHIILDGQKYPLYIHCLDGRHVVGMIVLVLRRLRGWDPQASQAEYIRFAGEIQDDLSMVNDFTGPITLSSAIPMWLRGEGDIFRRKAIGGIKLVMPSAVQSSGSSGTMFHTESREYQLKASLRRPHSASHDSPRSSPSQEQQQLISTPITPITPFGATFTSVIGNMKNNSTPFFVGGSYRERYLREAEDEDMRNTSPGWIKKTCFSKGTPQLIGSSSTIGGKGIEHKNDLVEQIMSMRGAKSTDGSFPHSQWEAQTMLHSKYVVVDPTSEEAPHLEDDAVVGGDVEKYISRGEIEESLLCTEDENAPFPFHCTPQSRHSFSTPKDLRIENDDFIISPCPSPQQVYYPLVVSSQPSSVSPSRSKVKHTKRRQSF